MPVVFYAGFLELAQQYIYCFPSADAHDGGNFAAALEYRWVLGSEIWFVCVIPHVSIPSQREN